MPDQDDKSVAGAALMAAAAFAIALVLTLIFAWRQPQDPQPAGQAVAPQAEATPDVRGNTRRLEQPAPPEATGAGPGQGAAC
jgi:hypothetical protein